MTAPATAVTRLDRLLRLARRDGAATLTLPNTDAQALLDLIGDLCEEHATCRCGATLCPACGLGEAVECAAGALETHCFACLDTCGPCLDDAVREFRAEQAEDVRQNGAV